MSLVLAIEPEASQAESLRQILRDRIGAELVLVSSAYAAVVAMNRQVPDLLLFNPSITEKNQSKVISHYQSLSGGRAPQTLVVPPLESGDAPAETSRFGFRRKAKPAGHSPEAFAATITAALERARATVAAVPPLPAPEPTTPPVSDVWLESPAPAPNDASEDRLVAPADAVPVMTAIDDEAAWAAFDAEEAADPGPATMDGDRTPAAALEDALSDWLPERTEAAELVPAIDSVAAPQDRGDLRSFDSELDQLFSETRVQGVSIEVEIDAEEPEAAPDPFSEPGAIDLSALLNVERSAYQDAGVDPEVHAAEIALIQVEAEAKLAAELERVRSEAAQQRAVELSRLQAEAEALREQTVSEARAAAEMEAREALTAELAKVRSEAEQTLSDALTRVRSEAEQTLASEVTRAREEAEQARRAEVARVQAALDERVEAVAKQAREAAEAEAARAVAEELKRARSEAERTFADELARVRVEAEQMLGDELGRAKADADHTRDAQIAKAQAEAEALRAAAVQEARAAAEQAAARALDAEVARVRAEAEIRVQEELQRVRAEAEQMWGSELGRVKADAHEARDTQIAQVQAEAEALRAAAVTEARTAAEQAAARALEDEVARVRAEAEARVELELQRVRAEAEQMWGSELGRVKADAHEARHTQIAQVQAEAEALRAAAVREARTAAEEAAAHALATEVARVRAEAEARVQDEVARIQSELERVRAEAERARLAERTEADAEVERARAAAAQEARASVEAALKAEIESVRAEADQRLASELATLHAEAERLRAVDLADLRSQVEQMREVAAQQQAGEETEAARTRDAAASARAVVEAALATEIERVRAEADARLAAEVAGLRAESERRRATELEEVRAQVARMREAATQQARSAAASAVATEVARANAQARRSLLERYPIDGAIASGDNQGRRRRSRTRRTRGLFVALPIAASLLFLLGSTSSSDVASAIRTAAGMAPPVTSSAVTTPGDVAPSASAPQAPAGPVGELRVESTPAGATILLDGRDRGLSPATLAGVPAGTHSLTLRSTAGTVTRPVRIRPGERTLVSEGITPGFIAVFSRIPLDVLLDGRRLGASEDGELMLPPGRYKVTLVNSRFNYHGQVTLDVTPGRVTPHTVDLPNGQLHISTEPGAQIWIEGVQVGEGPSVDVEVPIGTRDVLVRHPDLGERRQSVEVRFARRTDLTLTIGSRTSPGEAIKQLPPLSAPYPRTRVGTQ